MHVDARGAQARGDDGHLGGAGIMHTNPATRAEAMSLLFGTTR